MWDARQERRGRPALDACRSAVGALWERCGSVVGAFGTFPVSDRFHLLQVTPVTGCNINIYTVTKSNAKSHYKYSSETS